MTSERTMLYRDKQNSKIAGICSGIADYTGVNVLWIRLAALMLLFMTSGAIIPFYIIAAFLIGKKPKHLYVDQDEQRYWQRVRQSPKRTAREIRARFRDVDHRLAEIENYYVTSNPRLSAEIERLR